MQFIPNSANRILHADCLTALPRFSSGSIDFVLTDPPYLVSYHDRTGRTLAGDQDGLWLKPAFAEIYRVLKPGRFCVSFYGWNRADQFLSAWKAAGFKLAGHLVWVKDYASSRGVLAYQHEQAYLLAKGRPERPQEALPDVLKWRYTGNRLHPTQKPVPSLKPVIEAFTRPGEIVLDPFCGSGSTLLAAKILGRRYVGIEVNTEYCRTATERLLL